MGEHPGGHPEGANAGDGHRASAPAGTVCPTGRCGRDLAHSRPARPPAGHQPGTTCRRAASRSACSRPARAGRWPRRCCPRAGRPRSTSWGCRSSASTTGWCSRAWAAVNLAELTLIEQKNERNGKPRSPVAPDLIGQEPDPDGSRSASLLAGRARTRGPTARPTWTRARLLPTVERNLHPAWNRMP